MVVQLLVLLTHSNKEFNWDHSGQISLFFCGFPLGTLASSQVQGQAVSGAGLTGDSKLSVWIIVCLSVLALRQISDLSMVYPLWTLW